MRGESPIAGDPSGRDESRQLIDDSAIQRNIEGISLVFRKVRAY